jgi:hypothetical protein
MGCLLMNESIILNTLLLNNLSKRDASLFVTNMFQKWSFLSHDPHVIPDPFVVTINGGPFILASQTILHMCVTCPNPIMDVIYFFHLMVQLSKHYYKMWVQFISPHSLDQWIHYFPTKSCSLQIVNSLKIQWNHLAHKDTF